MKIIDLLNKIANCEEVPKKIKYKNKIYEWKEYDVCYRKIMTKKGWVKKHGYVAEENRTYFYLEHCYQDLNDEIEIIEEEKKIPEEIPYHFSLDYIHCNINETAKEEIDKTINCIYDKINEIIDYLKSKGDE